MFMASRILRESEGGVGNKREHVAFQRFFEESRRPHRSTRAQQVSFC